MTTRALGDRVSAWIFDGPPVEGGWMEHANLDATRLSFPAQVVILMITTAVTLAGSVWFTTGGLKSDVRDIVTRMEAQRELDTERTKSMQEAIASMQRQYSLQQYELQEMKNSIVQLKFEMERVRPQRELR